ncbi:unnamed protein product, partial [marine sediment metagenome]
DVSMQVDVGNITKEAAEDKVMVAQSEFAESYLNGLIDNNPALAVAEIDSGKYNEVLTVDQMKFFDKQADVIRDAQDKFKVRDINDALLNEFPDPDEAIAFLQKSGTSKELGITTAQNKELVSLMKDKRQEITLAENNKIKELKLKVDTAEDAEKVRVQADKDKISTDLFKLELNADFPGRLKYIENIPDEYGALKRKELDLYERDLKETKKTIKKEKYNDAEKKLIDEITFTPENVTAQDVRAVGQDAENREVLMKKFDASQKK